MEVAALIIFAVNFIRERSPQFGPKSENSILLGCLFVAVGIWVEKGMGLIIPGFVPTPLGDIVEYTPSLVETLVCAGIWAFGALIFTLLAKVCIGILSGKVKARHAH